MKIDEVIEKYRNRAKQYKDWDNMKDIAEDYEQLAEWLELLKWYQQGMEDIPSESGVLPRDVYRAGYNKAIDDFEKMAKEVKYQDGALSNIDLEYIAERLKAGGEDGR